MKHYGDITTIKGSEVPITDIVCGGSPCQDLSVAGKRAGLDGERSGLFMEQIRVIKEMRDEYTTRLRVRGSDVDRRLVKPRYMVWENVVGALSSGKPEKGEDFRIVLEETAKIADKNASIPRPPKGGWTPSGCIMGDGWSIAWRVHDGQFWGITITDPNGNMVKRGTPQRRKRISLVADFGGQSAPEILFESQSLSRDIEQGGQEREVIAPDIERGTNPSSFTLKVRGGAEFDRYGKRAGKGPLIQTELSGTLGVSQDQTLITGINGDRAGTLDASYYKGCGERQGIERDVVCVCIEGNGSRESHKGDGYKESDTMYTLNTVEQHGVAYGLDRASFNQGQNAKFDFSVEEEIAPTVVAKGPGGVMQRL